MLVKNIEIENFRLLKKVSLGLEEKITLIVGRNNSGKTSIAELFRRLLSDKGPSFRLEDFSLGSHEGFWSAFEALRAGESREDIYHHLPSIIINLDVEYDVESPDLGPISDCIIDLNPDCNFVRLTLTFGPNSVATESLFADVTTPPGGMNIERASLFRTVEERLPQSYECKLETVDPNDSTNRKNLDLKTIKILINGGFINAQRGLDDDTHRERDVLGKIIEVLFQSALTDPIDSNKRTTAAQLKTAVEQIQTELHVGFNEKLTSLLPTFDLFGYPGLADPGLVTETSFDVDKLLNNHTKIRYVGVNGITLPETYNGLGMRNLVYILLQLLRFFREYQATPTAVGVHLIFIEEPEAHMHPQMQEVFIRQLSKIAKAFETQLNENKPWPVQFVISTHSPHMANEARFESMRYFLTREGNDGFRQSVVKDLRKGMGNAPVPERDFLYQYLTLTRCDLFFADKAVLIEGTSERLLLPAMIRKTDAAAPGGAQLGSQYLTVMEVGGAYAHRFFDLLSFLELRTLIITDIDSVKRNANNKRIATPVASGEFTSNSCIKAWFSNNDITPTQLLTQSHVNKIVDSRRLAYQVPEMDGGPCARSFEDAFILANFESFALGDGDRATLAYEHAADQKKSTFALTYAIENSTWNVPRYISEGLRWLAEGNPVIVIPQVTPSDIAAAAAGIEISGEGLNDY
ncbi:ATP-dependent nuclease [Pantoea coffeiphila]|uniref:ATP-dependent nuclease n=1 Tax=Pantoea coffeiphila TaxID=1465635 RepID=UPI00195FB567|nr:ATP-dependent endonuclease [Pantoea coffeiphila]MBM7344236.1 putative ATP-dependent endonuclease of OLD family [Pantoea coffeiphila]